MAKKEKKERIASDFYETPPWCVDHFMEGPGRQLPGGVWLEPAAGHGAIIKAVNRHKPNLRWAAVEIRNEACFELSKHMNLETNGALGDLLFCADFLRSESIALPTIDVVMGNPPWSLAEEFVRACLPIAPWVALLLRSTFDGSGERIPLHTEFKSHKDILPVRPKFDHDATDFADTAWFVWGPDRKAREFSTWDIRPFNTGQLSLLEGK